MTAGNPPIKVLCIQDDAPTRQRLTGVLARDRRFAVEQAGTLEEEGDIKEHATLNGDVDGDSVL
jgi:hypothetical protein